MQYEVKQLNTGSMLEIIELATTNPKEFQLEMVKRAIYIDGAPVGDKVLEMPFSDYMEMAVKAMEAHSFGEEAKRTNASRVWIILSGREFKYDSYSSQARNDLG